MTDEPPLADSVRLARGCWGRPAEVEELALRCALLLETSAEDTVVVGTTAARLHELWLPSLPDEVHLATGVPGLSGTAMTRTRRPEIRAHRRQLPTTDVLMIDGVPRTTMARTWRDLAPLLDLPSLVAAGDSVLRAGVTSGELAEVLARTGRHAGIGRARAALALLDGRSRSRPESHLRVAASAPDLPRFEVNEPVHRSDGGWLAEPGLSLAEAKIALEYQGADHAEVGRMRKDITRSTDMRRDRWVVIEYGPAEVFGRPQLIAPELRLLVRERAPHLRRVSRAWR